MLLDKHRGDSAENGFRTTQPPPDRGPTARARDALWTSRAQSAIGHVLLSKTPASPSRSEPPARSACSGPRRSVRVISTVANLSDGPTSSAVTSTRLRRSPLSFSQLLWSKRPDTTTRLPLT